jgi:peptidyl-prolyl cis-trans isomerase A (cyclophilin A)
MMFRILSTSRILFAMTLLGLLCSGTPSALAQTNDIFADFTTSMGGFTCRLEYAKSPKATANFIGLATGNRAWLDVPTGRVRTNKFYNGLTFHRVIQGFMIQGGSPNGLGTDGPGYALTDELDPSLQFSGPGVLAMANSGPNSSGSQFFLTVTNTPWLNGVHTIFGQVIAGQNVVDAISKVATDANNKPLTNVVIQSIGIRRVGANAQAFDIDQQSLPVVAAAPLGIRGASGQVTLLFTNNLYADNRLATSTNLLSWSSTPLGVDITSPPTNNVSRSTDVSARFFTLAQVQYPSSTFAPRTVYSRNLTLVFNGGVGTIAIAFDTAGGGTYTYSLGSPGTVTSYSWTQDIYRGTLWPIQFSGVVPMTLQLNFTNTTAGTFSGTAYPSPNPNVAVSGNYTLTGP